MLTGLCKSKLMGTSKPAIEAWTSVTRRKQASENASKVRKKKIFENKEIGDFIIKNIEDLKSSENIFVFFEISLSKEILEILKKYSAKVLEFKKPKNILNKQEKKGGLTLFNLTDAFAQKNQKTAWLILQKLLMQGISEEEIFWKIFWQIKMLSAVKPYQNKNSQEVSEELKIHPFVAGKSLAAAKRFETNELQNLSQKLIEIYKNNRFNKIELSFGLEQLILNL